MNQPTPPPNLSRRRLLGMAATTWAGATLLRPVRGAAPAPASGPPVNLAAVGVGGIGFSQLKLCEQAGFRIAALCDLDDAYAKKTYDQWPQARRHRDFREMLRQEGAAIDAVYIGTPDHTHAIVALEALRHRKHVLCVKPLARTIEETRVLVEAAHTAGVATQMTATPATQEAACRTCELIGAGAIGDVTEVQIWSDRPMWPQGMARPPGEDAVPAGFDWDLWLGPAPRRPFRHKWPAGDPAIEQIVTPGGPNRSTNPADDPIRGAVYHPWNFRGWYDFGTGALGDMGCHFLNTPRRALQLGHPSAIAATASRLMGESWPLASIVAWDFPARGGLPPVRVTWYDGGLRPPRPRELEPGRELPKDGVLYLGTKGKILVTGLSGGPRLIPESRMAESPPPPRTLERRAGIYGEWMEAIRGGPPASQHWPEGGGALTELVLLGCIAIRTGGTLQWDGDAGRFTNSAPANELLKANYQNGWTLAV